MCLPDCLTVLSYCDCLTGATLNTGATIYACATTRLLHWHTSHCDCLADCLPLAVATLPPSQRCLRNSSPRPHCASRWCLCVVTARHCSSLLLAPLLPERLWDEILAHDWGNDNCTGTRDCCIPSQPDWHKVGVPAQPDLTAPPHCRPLTAAPSLRFKHWCLGANNATAALPTGLLTKTEHWGNIEHWQFCGNTERWGNIEQ